MLSLRASIASGFDFSCTSSSDRRARRDQHDRRQDSRGVSVFRKRGLTLRLWSFALPELFDEVLMLRAPLPPEIVTICISSTATLDGGCVPVVGEDPVPQVRKRVVHGQITISDRPSEPQVFGVAEIRLVMRCGCRRFARPCRSRDQRAAFRQILDTTAMQVLQGDGKRSTLLTPFAVSINSRTADLGVGLGTRLNGAFPGRVRRWDLALACESRIVALMRNDAPSHRQPA